MNILPDSIRVHFLYLGLETCGRIEYTKHQKRKVAGKFMKKYFDSAEFREAFHCRLPLGSFCGSGGTLFRLWSPTAERVELRLYSAGNETPPIKTVPMAKKEKGAWEYEALENLDGVYYDYGVTAHGKLYETPDPYGKACGVNGVRSMVLDLRRTDPEGWREDKAPAKTPEQVIYELHIKDFSWDSAGGFDPEDRGRYSAFTKSGITLHNAGAQPTGLDYLKQLGVTHIQLLPMYDYGSVDEAHPESGYNWGYDPVNYNVPEGSYSSDPYHGEIRIRQLKEMVASLHAKGFRVIMDVVYNHTYSLDSPLFKSAPWYYYRQNPDGTSSNGSGCGNDIASERSMCARYILESALYWVEEYHIDGFRFDLMGLLDTDLMERIQKALDERYGEGEKLIYGEPWRAGNTAAMEGVTLCDKSALKKLDGRIGAFCDDTRDAVKGSVMDAEGVGFVNGGLMTAEKLKKCVAGWAGEFGPNQTPCQTINYLSCHDDWTLWDKLIYTMDPNKRFTGSDPAILQANRLAAAIYFSCQGKVFIHAGEEFGRTKGGIKNSYCSSAEVNRLDWQRAWENKDLVDYYRGLISLRMQLPGLQDKTSDAGKRILYAKDFAHNCAGVLLDNKGENSKWEQILLCFNCSKEPVAVSLPAGSWQVLTDGENSFLWKRQVMVENTGVIPPMSAWILGK